MSRLHTSARRFSSILKSSITQATGSAFGPVSMPASMFTDAYRVMVECLVEARRSAGLSQTELGRRMGKGQKFVSVIETGVRRIDLVEFVEWSKALERNPIDLFSAILTRAFGARDEELDEALNPTSSRFTRETNQGEV